MKDRTAIGYDEKQKYIHTHTNNNASIRRMRNIQYSKPKYWSTIFLHTKIFRFF